MTKSLHGSNWNKICFFIILIFFKNSSMQIFVSADVKSVFSLFSYSLKKCIEKPKKDNKTKSSTNTGWKNKRYISYCSAKNITANKVNK